MNGCALRHIQTALAFDAGLHNMALTTWRAGAALGGTGSQPPWVLPKQGGSADTTAVQSQTTLHPRCQSSQGCMLPCDPGRTFVASASNRGPASAGRTCRQAAGRCPRSPTSSWRTQSSCSCASRPRSGPRWPSLPRSATPPWAARAPSAQASPTRSPSGPTLARRRPAVPQRCPLLVRAWLMRCLRLAVQAQRSAKQLMRGMHQAGAGHTRVISGFNSADFS